MIASLFILFLFGLIFGSFITSFTYRLPKGELLPKGRSYCPKCKKKILWFDNIPLFSYLFLRGKCRNCKKHISFRYPLIEGICGILFVVVYSHFTKYGLPSHFSWYAIPFWLFVTCILVAIFIIDLEHQIIPDELSLLLFALLGCVLIFGGNEKIYIHALCGFGAALFLLTLNLITKGRGMGLGDVKLALGIGLFFGWPFTFLWLFLSFVIGASFGIVLILFKKAELGKHIAFGPFLIVSFFIVLLWGEYLSHILMPYLSL